MAVNYGINLANGEIIGTSNTVVYTVGTDVVRTVINQARIVNYSAGVAVTSVYILQNGESVADNFKALDAKSLGANEEYIISEIIGDSIGSGGSIVLICDTATSVSFSATGTEFTS